MPHPSDHLRSIHNFDELIQYLEDKLGWPLNEYGFDDLIFQYDAEELVTFPLRIEPLQTECSV